MTQYLNFSWRHAFGLCAAVALLIFVPIAVIMRVGLVLFAWHPILLCLGYLSMLLAISAYYMPLLWLDKDPLRARLLARQLHAGFQSSAACLILFGVIVIVVNKAQRGKSIWSGSWHAWVGAVSACLALTQAGFGALKAHKPLVGLQQRERTPSMEQLTAGGDDGDNDGDGASLRYASASGTSASSTASERVHAGHRGPFESLDAMDAVNGTDRGSRAQSGAAGQKGGDAGWFVYCCCCCCTLGSSLLGYAGSWFRLIGRSIVGACRAEWVLGQHGAWGPWVAGAGMVAVATGVGSLWRTWVASVPILAVGMVGVILVWLWDGRYESIRRGALAHGVRGWAMEGPSAEKIQGASHGSATDRGGALDEEVDVGRERSAASMPGAQANRLKEVNTGRGSHLGGGDHIA